MGIDRALARDRETVPGSQPASTVPLIDLHYLVRTKLEQERAGRAGRTDSNQGQKVLSFKKNLYKSKANI